MWLGIWGAEEKAQRSKSVFRFLPRNAMQSAVLPWQVVYPFVRPSFCLSDDKPISVQCIRSIKIVILSTKSLMSKDNLLKHSVTYISQCNLQQTKL